MLKSPDALLEPFTKYFLWPPAFGDQGDQSLCFTHNKGLGTDLYCSAGVRAIAESLHRPLPPLGCGAVALQDWQILQSKQLLEKAHDRRAQKGKTSRYGVSPMRFSPSTWVL